MIVSKKSHQNLSDYIQILFKKYFNLIKDGIISSEKVKNPASYNYDYAHLVFGKDF